MRFLPRTAIGAAALLGAAATLGVSLVGAGPGRAAPAPDSCHPWSSSVISSGHGVLENLAFDGRGGMLLSRSNLGPGSSIDRLQPDGRRDTVVRDIDAPGAIVVQGNRAYFATGNSFTAGLTPGTGTVDYLDLDTGARHPYARGLTAPNGMAFLSNGDIVVSSDTAAPGLTLVPKGAPDRPAPYALTGVTTNGIAVDAATGTLYTDSTFDPATKVYALDIAAPAAAPREWTIGGFGPFNSADDLTIDAQGNVYVALNVGGKVVRVNTATGAQCTIAEGLLLTSSLRFGAGPGWDPNSLYVTGFDGTVRKLTP